MITDKEKTIYGQVWAETQFCFYCGGGFGKEKNGKLKTREHWIDKSVGGTYFVAAHNKCNTKNHQYLIAITVYMVNLLKENLLKKNRYQEHKENIN